ncbi:proline iminopeptidase-family hydrolase [Umezawaea sp. Da 62-37]|uniref:proline iminopeptidase-family hydrolase n=1 Tax=Umezawaea sp. Da 62-37 TaxID=3075927 RepID=UPI0028F73FDC|nr:proline iminopeptidase-family hydrolase [Umezawaea sp. Da 62-37]WNV85350.1 proline iminopeptidase-family hydrolase [Umezawaea sp. Da 62-37]
MNVAAAPTAKGWVPFGEHRTWYRVTGDVGGELPAVVVVHGGPGSTHDYLLNLCSLAEHGWPVVHYDQLGSGGSTRLPDRGADFWTPELFGDELDNLVRRLGVEDNYVLFGQSWGGLVVARHAAQRPDGLRGLVIANSPASYPLWRREMDVLRAQLPPGVDDDLRAHEAAGTTDSPEYFRQMRVFYNRHVCRLRPWPADYVASFMEMADDNTVYAAMNGPSEFTVTGTLKDYSVVDLLEDIEVPTLLISGRHDEATPVTVQPYFDQIHDVRWEVFEDSSHVPHLEEPERFHEVLLGFLQDVQPTAPAFRGAEREVSSHG